MLIIGLSLLSITGWLYSIYLAFALHEARVELNGAQWKKDRFNENFKLNKRKLKRSTT